MHPVFRSLPLGRLLFDSRMAVLFFAFFATVSHAQLLFEAAFNDPDGTLSQVDPATVKAPFKGKNIATCFQGKVIPVMTVSPQDASQAPAQHLQVLTDPPMSGPFLRASQQGGVFSSQTYCGVEVTPDFAGSSLAALSSVEKDKVVLDGAFDIFLRATQDPASDIQFKILDCSAKEGLRLTFGANRSNNRLFAGLIGLGDFFDTDLDGKADARQVSTLESRAGATTTPIESGKSYHAAVAFATAPDGVTTMRVFLKEGLGAIDTTKPDDLNGEVTFRILNAGGKLKNGLPAEKILFGTFPTRTVFGMTFTIDLAAFRIFKPTPGVFPGLPE